MRAIVSKSSAATLLILGLLAGICASAASFTSIGANDREPSLVSILDQTYGAGGYQRISDDIDQIWGARVIVSIAVISVHSSAWQRLGLCVICDRSDDTYFGPSVAAAGALAVTPGNELLADADLFRWLDAAAGAPMVGKVSSDPSLNPGGVDQMITFAIFGQPGVYALAFEDWLSDYPGEASDRDFNDFVVEVSFETPSDLTVVPEPAAIVLFVTALLALAITQRRSRRCAS